jgi:serine protease
MKNREQQPRPQHASRWQPFAALLLGLACTVPAWADDAARVIVKYRTDSTLLASAPNARAQALAVRTQTTITTQRELRPRVQLVQATGISSETLAARLAAQADVEYAVPDRVKHIRAVPNDPLFSSQWYLQQATATQAAAINAVGAWDITQGSNTIIVAVVDTGIRPEHPDLASKIVPGYDFITNPTIANDGDGRDADPSDPGDYVTQADFNNPLFNNQDCGAGVNVPVNSSWHGTQVSGIVAAATNNSTGVAGVGWNTMVEPIRVLGKCGGYDSDIIDGMLWAAGVAQVCKVYDSNNNCTTWMPTNPNPAQVLNLSLGGSGTCSAAYIDAINQITAKGVVVVIAAGNDSPGPGVGAKGDVEEPGNCPGVLAVAGLRHVGSKVGYSSFGPEVGIAAPAGNCVNSTGACLYPIVTTTNTGTTVPVSSTYSDQTNYSVGTSFSTPQAAGVAALIHAVHPGLTSAGTIQRIKNGATPFPVDPTEQACPTVDSSGMCNCTTTTCGAGMLNALGAVTDALRPEAIITAVTGAVAGQSISVPGTASTAASGHLIATYAWSITSDSGTSSSLSNASQAIATLLASAAGSVVVSLTVTDEAGKTDTTTQTITVAASSSGSGGGSGSGGSGSGGTTTSSGGGGGAVDPLGIAAIGLLGLLGYAVRRERRQR